ncbi:MAG: hypothetical protein LPK45_03925 [Bacteroidota bacterium]|nr:hypothetical protein [Bacteroidota bacterium]MDX5430198.1 hypothetical protein [Bacteroidota bacterium]MDX5468961.1 hypothetical protein [Bacteroidota bacterium]
MKRIVFLLVFGLSLSVSAQEHVKQYGGGIQPFYSMVRWTSGTAAADSLNQRDQPLPGINPQAWFLVEWKRYNSLQLGLQYSMYGFQRREENVTFGKVYHPDLPKITDWIQGDPRHIDFYYRTHYLTIPMIWNRQLTRFRKSLNMHYFFTAGVSVGVKVFDKTIAKTRGFGFDGRNRFALNNQYKSEPITANVHLGGRFEYVVDARYRAHIQPLVNIPLISNFKGEKAFVPSLGLNLFITLQPEQQKGE